MAQALARAPARADAIVVTGDIGDDCSEGAYRRFAAVLRDTGIPAWCLPGNHDDPARMASLFASGSLRYAGVAALRGWRLLLLESPVPGEPHGELGAARLAALRRTVVEALVAHGVQAAVDRIEAIAHARIAGYQFNPVSFFCAYDAAGALLGVVADVHNTFGERHAYVLTAAAATAAGHWAEKKVFHVSPFFTLDGSYRFALDLAPDAIDIRIDLLDGGQPVFVSRLALTASPLTDRALAGALLRFQSMTVRVIGAIHWEALRLWRRGLPYLSKPAYDPAAARATTRP